MAAFKLDRLGVRERIGLAAAVICALLWSLDQFVVKSVSRRLADLDLAAAQQREALAYNVKVLETRGEVERLFGAVSGALNRTASDAEGIDAFKSAIDALARTNGVMLIAVEHRKPDATASSSCRQYVVDVRKFECGMPNLVRFLHELWAAPGMMRVEKLTLAPGPDRGKLEGSMVITEVAVPAT